MQSELDLVAMWRIRAFEEQVRELRLTEELLGSVHLCIGQEAVAVGTCRSLSEVDPVFATYRGHGWALARGVPAERLFAELLGRSTGTNGGRAGSAYLSGPEWGFYGENSIVGAGAPIAVGAALAARFDGSGRVAVTVFGDGAMNQGAVHEAFNMAAALRLPVVFVCENNGWSELTPIDAMVGDPELFRRAAGYGMPGVRVDGNDCETVADAVADAVARARGGGGPSLVETMTQRLVGHYIGDAELYRRPGELEEANRREPIAVLEARLLARGVAASRLEELEAAVRQELAADLERARAAAPAVLPTPGSLVA
jgi:pyruvate dehydrogenase E1 component alpha subunit